MGMHELMVVIHRQALQMLKQTFLCHEVMHPRTPQETQNEIVEEKKKNWGTFLNS
jgi:hypothetical protein